PRFRIAFRIVHRRLRRSEDAKRARGQLGTEQERLDGRDERVAAEHGHEPRRSRGEQPAEVGLARAHAQAREIGDRAVPRVHEIVPACAQPGRGRTPRDERFLGPPALLVELARERRAREGRDAVELWLDADDEAPALARLELERESRHTLLLAERLGQMDDRAGRIRGICEHERTVPRALERPRRRKLVVARRPESGLELLHHEDVREVRLELEAELDLDPAAAVVLDGDALLHAVADEALAFDGQLVWLEAVDERVAEDERREVRRRLIMRKRLEALASEREHGAGEEPRIRREEAGRRGDAVDV